MVCATPKCSSGHCFTFHEPPGTVAPPRVAGDCAVRVCDGAGNVVLTPDSTDPPAGSTCTSPTSCAPPDPAYQGGDLLWSKDVAIQCNGPSPTPLNAALLVGPTGDAVPWSDCPGVGDVTVYRRLTGSGLLVESGSISSYHEVIYGLWLTSQNVLAKELFYSIQNLTWTTVWLGGQPGGGWKSQGCPTCGSNADQAKFSGTVPDRIGNIYAWATATKTYPDTINAAITLPGPGTFLVRDGVSGGGLLAGVPASPFVPDEAGGALLLVSPAIAQQLGCAVGPTTSTTALVRLGPTWACLWAVPTGGSSPSMLADGSGGVVLSATASDTVDLGCGALAAAPSGSTFVTRFDASGACAYTKSLPLPGLRVQRTPAGVLVSGGAGAEAVDLGGGPLAALGTQDLVLAAYDGAGGHRWSRRAGGAGLSIDKAKVTVIEDGGVVVTVRYDGSADFGGGAVQASSTQLTMASYTAAGDHRWSRPIDIDGDSAAVDGCGGLYTAKYVQAQAPAGLLFDHITVKRYQP